MAMHGVHPAAQRRSMPNVHGKCAHLSQRQLCLADRRQGFGLHESHRLRFQAVLP